MRWLIILLLFNGALRAQSDFYQEKIFTRADSLRGGLRPERTCFDVTFYGLHLTVDPVQRSIDGYVDVQYRQVADFRTLQLDLYDNLRIDRIVSGEENLNYRREHNAVFVTFPQTQSAGHVGSLRVYYHGQPREAVNPPWDGGFVWSKDREDRHWIGVACQGDGASLWWPNKDHLSDEPDSMLISVAVPERFMCVANGNLRGTEPEGANRRYNWFVSYPINNYNVSINIGHYEHFSDQYLALDGDTLALDYYVLDYNLKRAREHFRQVGGVLRCYEQYLDKYPFWEDGFALVETPYLGMEHQSGIAYGNKYLRGYLGGMIPRGQDWDYIIVHETGHEYFGNSLSVADLSEMWLHESFTTYLEAVYIECRYNKEAAVDYLAGQQFFVENREPILGPADVNWDNWEGSDHYYKGALLLHTLRHAINDDQLWWDIFKGFYRRHARQHVTTADFVRYVNEATGQNWQSFFDQYLAYPRLPILRYELSANGNGLKVRYRWEADAPGFAMPVLIGKKDQYERVFPVADEWRETVLKGVKKEDFRVATELQYVEVEEVK